MKSGSLAAVGRLQAVFRPFVKMECRSVFFFLFPGDLEERRRLRSLAVGGERLHFPLWTGTLPCVQL